MTLNLKTLVYMFRQVLDLPPSVDLLRHVPYLGAIDALCDMVELHSDEIEAMTGRRLTVTQTPSRSIHWAKD